MTTYPVEVQQRTAARVVGAVYLFGFVALFNEFYVRGRLIVDGNAAETARNITTHERLFRLGTAVDLVEIASIVVLAAALYTVLKPVSQSLALLGAFWRLMEAAICVVMTLSSFDVLSVLSGAEYLRTFEPDRLHALARMYIGAHGAGYNVAEMFLGLGSTVFACLWFKSGYIPGALAAWGVFASLLVAVCTLAFVVFPCFGDLADPACYVPIGIFEVAMAFWLLIKGLPPARLVESMK